MQPVVINCVRNTPALRTDRQLGRQTRRACLRPASNGGMSVWLSCANSPRRRTDDWPARYDMRIRVRRHLPARQSLVWQPRGAHWVHNNINTQSPYLGGASQYCACCCVAPSVTSFALRSCSPPLCPLRLCLHTHAATLVVFATRYALSCTPLNGCCMPCDIVKQAVPFRMRALQHVGSVFRVFATSTSTAVAARCRHWHWRSHIFSEKLLQVTPCNYERVYFLLPHWFGRCGAQ